MDETFAKAKNLARRCFPFPAFSKLTLIEEAKKANPFPGFAQPGNMGLRDNLVAEILAQNWMNANRLYVELVAHSICDMQDATDDSLEKCASKLRTWFDPFGHEFENVE